MAHYFADGYPYLITSMESLADINEKIMESGGEAIPMDRFRSNIVIEGWAKAFQEHRIKKLRIGKTVFQAAKPCVRCVVTTTDQETGARAKSKEPANSQQGRLR